MLMRYIDKKGRGNLCLLLVQFIEASRIALPVRTSNEEAPRQMYIRHHTPHPIRASVHTCINTQQGAFTVALFLTGMKLCENFNKSKPKRQVNAFSTM